jgi:histidine triad (HIT) family protein
MSTIFSKIIRGEAPCYLIFEDELVFAFLNIRPIQSGHTLVVPKREVDHVLDVAEQDYRAVFAAGQRLGRAIQKATSCRRVAYAVAGFEVPHFHLHLIPAWDISDTSFAKQREASPADLASMQARIRGHL